MRHETQSAQRDEGTANAWLDAALNCLAALVSARVSELEKQAVPAPLTDLPGLPNEKIGQEGLEPERTLVLVAMNHFANEPVRCHGRTGEFEMQLHVPAVAAFELGRDVTGERQPTAPAERWHDKLNRAPARPAPRADVPLGRDGPFGITNLTDIRIEKTQRRFEGSPDNVGQGNHSSYAKFISRGIGGVRLTASHR